jgi:hypothetical protein
LKDTAEKFCTRTIEFPTDDGVGVGLNGTPFNINSSVEIVFELMFGELMFTAVMFGETKCLETFKFLNDSSAFCSVLPIDIYLLFCEQNFICLFHYTICNLYT